VLVAEDDPRIAELVKTILAPEGYSLTVVPDGNAALAAYEAEKPDLLILDHNMPGRDGMSICEQVRKTDERVLILILTAERVRVNTISSLDAGADYYMTKPFGARELLARVKALLRRLEG
jgi:DNA-binding response OmpR family regulator